MDGDVKEAMKENIIKERLMDSVVIIVIILMVVPYILKFDVPYLNTDEFGYWGSASFFSGYDWATVVSTNGYFSYGYGFILAILLICFKNPIVCFKMCIVLNALFLIGLYLTLKKILLLIVARIDFVKRCIMSFVATFYCAMVTYAGMSIPECLLAFLFALNVYFLLLFFLNPSWNKGAGILLLSLYMYTVHQRTIVFFILNVVFVIGYLFKMLKGETKKNVIKMLVLIVLFCLAYSGISMLKEKLQSSVWLISESDNSAVVYNDFSGQVGKIKLLFSIEGIKEAMYSFCGRIFYALTSTYGLILLFFANAVRCLVNKEESNIVKIFYLYTLLSMCGAIAISCVFLIKPTSTTYLFYGRYCDNIMPLVVLATCLFLKRISKKSIALIILVINGLGLILSRRIMDAELSVQNTSVSHVAMSVYYVDEKLDVLAVALFIVLVFSMSIFFLKDGRRLRMIILGVMYSISSIYIGYNAVNQFYKEEMLNNIAQAVEIANEIKAQDIEEVCVVVTDRESPGKKDKYGKIIQFINPSLKINLSLEIPEMGGYFVKHVGTTESNEDVTILKENAGYVLGKYDIQE